MEEKQRNPFRKFIGRYMVLVTLIILAISGVLFHLEQQAARQFYLEIYHNKMLVTHEYTRRVISDVYVAVTNNLYYLEHSLNEPDSHKATMARIVKSGTRIRSCGISFVEGYYPQKGRRFCPFAWRDPAHMDAIYSEDKGDDDYDYLEAGWFHETVKNDSARWSEPFYDGYDESTALSAYMVPIHDQTGRVVAVLGADISLEWFAQKLSETDSTINNKKMAMAGMLKIKSKSFIINHDGTYITHSDDKRILTDNFFQQLEPCGGKSKEELVSAIANRGETLQSHERVLVDGKECYLFSIPVKYTQWILVTVVPCQAIDWLCYLNGGAVALIVLLSLLLLVYIGYRFVKRIARQQPTK